MDELDLLRCETASENSRIRRVKTELVREVSPTVGGCGHRSFRHVCFAVALHDTRHIISLFEYFVLRDEYSQSPLGPDLPI